MLFDQKERTRVEPKQPGENYFQFYDTAAGADYDTYRDLVNGWIAELPEATRADRIARFRADDRFGYQSTLAELMIHAALIRQGYKVEPHPKIEGIKSQIDFLVRNQDDTVAAYVEVTSFGPSQQLFSRGKRGSDIYNYMDQAKLPLGYRLGINFKKYGALSPSSRKLRRQVEDWAHKAAKNNTSDTISKVFEIGDWQIEFFVFSGFPTDTIGTRAIAGGMDEGRIITPQLEIKDALVEKADKYGALDAPYLIVIADLKDELPGGQGNSDALLDAAFGTVFVDPGNPDDGPTEPVWGRRCDGYLGLVGRPKQRHVSGVLLLPKANLWQLRHELWQPVQVRHPWATHPLPDELLAVPGHTGNSTGEIIALAGAPFADLLGLPEVWPH